MGGNAFSSGPSPLSTPRMPPSTYHTLRTNYLSLLAPLYALVATPIEAPSKASHGDIDILVSTPNSPSTLSTAALSTHLGAVRTFAVPGNPTTSFAVPYPGLDNQFVQVDVHTCSGETFEWQLFHQSHGDLWNLLGTAIRPFGLTANDAGLHVRIAEIEEANRRKSLVLLTRSPSEVCRFLGVDGRVVERSFESLEAMFDFAGSCRFFRGDMYGKERLKANDRKRMAQREVYRRFVEEWVPKHCEGLEVEGERNEDDDTAALTRKAVLVESLETFGKKEEYEKRLREWQKERNKLLAKQQGKAKRRAEAADLDDYARAWIRWLRPDVHVE